ncbi:MAG: 4Fe-4S dicluster domain-containing protein [Pirellulaceae bacterium]|nr:4Fe-4S dicluster domain-containing protein [Pirellulaceae bacterium]
MLSTVPRLEGVWMNSSIAVARPQRWDHPLDPTLAPQIVAWLLKEPPFCQMDVSSFASYAPLPDILKNDARLHKLATGDVLFQKGQYGGSAYLVLRGTVRMFLADALAAAGNELGTVQARPTASAQGRHWLAWFSKQTSDAKVKRPVMGLRDRGHGARVFLQDIPGILDQYQSTTANAGELFGEMAAVTRTAREFTAVAQSDCLVLEIRWQGLKLLRQSPEFRTMLDQRYRSRVLKDHLRETPLMTNVPDDDLDQVIAATRLESFGDMEWYADFRDQSQQSATDRIAREPLIADEGTYAAGLWILRGGFARLSRRQGAGHRTLAYLGKGQLFGLRELAHNWREPSEQTSLPFQESLRAIGYVDALCIPKQIVFRHILPYVAAHDLPTRINAPSYRFGQPVLDAPIDKSQSHLDTGLLEFLVEKRLMNGRAAMVIDTNRCTRCDDCVKACAATHNDTPLFERRGAQYGPWLFAQACMHCEDPVCMIGCPTGAIHREESTGLVQINSNSCIGCKACAESCPYDNIRMLETTDQRGRKQVDKQGLPILQASKCDLCQGSGGRPACQSACPHDALVRIDMSDLKGIQAWLQSKGD